MGLFSAHLLAGLARRKASLGISEPLGASFDIVAGTSVGAILAAAVAADIAPAVVVRMMEEHGARIFPRRRWRPTAPGIWAARFPAEPLRRALAEKLGDRRLGDLDRALLIPAMDETTGRAVMFRSHDPLQTDVRLLDAALASAAAPGYFPLHAVESSRYADGGLIANGPELFAALDLDATFGVPVARQRVLSVGTTRFPSDSPAPDGVRTSWGILDWVLRRDRLVPLVMSAQIDLHAQALSWLGPRCYLKLDLVLPQAMRGLVHFVRADDVARETLKDAARRALHDVEGADADTIDLMLMRRARRMQVVGSGADRRARLVEVL